MAQVDIHPSWYSQLEEEFSQDYFQKIKAFLISEKSKGKIIYPPGSLIFNAFNSTPFDKVKVVILGQDPYHNPGEAMGLSFSVPKGVRIPPSLRNIYKELASDLKFKIPQHGDLSKWTSEGVLLLNAMLTVEKKNAGSHKNIGWQTFTNAVISTLSSNRTSLVFMLWGNFARSKKELIDSSKHLILESPHPSPLARGGFFNNKHFSKANHYLLSHGHDPINWQLIEG